MFSSDLLFVLSVKGRGGQEHMELYLHSFNMPSWRGAQLKHRNNFTFTFFILVISKR